MILRYYVLCIIREFRFLTIKRQYEYKRCKCIDVTGWHALCSRRLRNINAPDLISLSWKFQLCPLEHQSPPSRERYTLHLWPVILFQVIDLNELSWTMEAGKRRFVCPICTQLFSTKRDCKEHLLARHFNRKPRCRCGKRFNWDRDLQKHTRETGHRHASSYQDVFRVCVKYPIMWRHNCLGLHSSRAVCRFPT